jgi:hypothetical protein
VKGLKNNTDETKYSKNRYLLLIKKKDHEKEKFYIRFIRYTFCSHHYDSL